MYVFVAVVIQHAICMCCIALSCAASLALWHFSKLSHERHNFQKKVLGHKMCVLLLSTTFVWNVSHSKKHSMRWYHKCINVFMYSTHYSYHISMILEFSWQILKKSSNIKFHENPSSGSLVFPCIWTDTHTHDTANSCYLQFWKHA